MSTARGRFFKPESLALCVAARATGGRGCSTVVVYPRSSQTHDRVRNPSDTYPYDASEQAASKLSFTLLRGYVKRTKLPRPYAYNINIQKWFVCARKDTYSLDAVHEHTTSGLCPSQPEGPIALRAGDSAREKPATHHYDANKEASESALPLSMLLLCGVLPDCILYLAGNGKT